MTKTEFITYKEMNLIERIDNEKLKYANKPTKQDYVRLKRVLRDFGINLSSILFPNFKNFAEMERWQHKYIKEYLNNIVH